MNRAHYRYHRANLYSDRANLWTLGWVAFLMITASCGIASGWMAWNGSAWSSAAGVAAVLVFSGAVSCMRRARYWSKRESGELAYLKIEREAER